MDTTETTFQELLKSLPVPSFVEYEPDGRYKTKLVEMPENLKPRPVRKHKRVKRKLATSRHAFRQFMQGFIVTGLVMLNVVVLGIGLFFFSFLFTFISPEEVVGLYNETAIEIMEENSLLPTTEWVEFESGPDAIAVKE